MTSHDTPAHAARPFRSPAEAWKVREAMLREGFTPDEVEEALQDTGLVAPVVSPYGSSAAVGHLSTLPPPAGYPVPGYARSPVPAPVAGYMPRPPFVPGQGYAPSLFMAPTGKEAYMLGFLAYIPIPLVSSLVTGAVMALAYPGQRRKSALAAENGRRAANWGLTYALATVLIVAGTVLLGLLAEPGSDDVPLLILLVIPLGVAHLVVTIRGAMVAGRGEVFENPLAIPFLRGGR